MKRLPFLIVFFAVPLFAADPPPPDVSPAIVELSPLAAPPAPPPLPVDTPYPLSPDRYRWFTLRGASGPITWEVEPAGIVGISEIAKPTMLFGKVEGATKPDFFDLPVGAVVVWPDKGDGTVRLSAFGVVDGKAKRLASIKIQTGPPGPLPPPIPPPTPPIPPPTDPFARGLWDAYQLETASTKAADAAAWAAVFRAAVGHVDTANPPIRTALDLHNDLKSALASTRPGALPRVKPLILAELVTAFGTLPAPLNKDAAKVELQKIAQALEGLR